MIKKSAPIIVLSLLLTFAASPVLAAGPFDKDTHYQFAVPNFIDAIKNGTLSAKDPSELDEIYAWAQDAEARLPEFLDDLLVIAQQLEAQGTPEFIFEKYSAFADKWNTISQTYPGLNELDPILSPIIDQLFAGMPTLQGPSSDNPMSGFADLYRALDTENPWFLRRLFRLEPVHSRKSLTVQEIIEEEKIAGVRKKSIVFRETLARVNDFVVFFERIINDQSNQFFVEFRDPTIIHEIIPLMIEDDQDPAVIAALEDMADLIDVHLQNAVNNGVLDPCSHGYLYRKNLGNSIQNCVDKYGETQDAPKIFRYNPWDDVNQVKLTEADALTAETEELPGMGQMSERARIVTSPEPGEIEMQPILEEYQKGFKAPAQTYLIGILFPAYLLSVIGFFRGL